MKVYNFWKKQALLYTFQLSSYYLSSFHCITGALINAVVMQWNTYK
jgi:hypothetical protein